MKKITFHSENIEFKLSKEDYYEKWITKVITDEAKNVGEISYIFCSDEYLLKINQDYLEHDYFTDIITFDYTEMGIISGDLFISIDRVKDNATQLNITVEEELKRVMIHGVLHLIGYKDKLPEEVTLMRQKEEESIAVFDQIVI